MSKKGTHWVQSEIECKHCKGTGTAPYNRWVTDCCEAVVRFASMTGEAYCSKCRRDVELPDIWETEQGEK